MNVYIPLSEQLNPEHTSVFFYQDENGEAHGGLDPNPIKIQAGDRKLRVITADRFHGHFYPSTSTGKKSIKEGKEMHTYKSLLEYINETKNESPLVYHFETRSESNGGSQIYQRGSLNKEKAEKMSDGRPVKSTPLHLYKGHLMSHEWNG